LATQKALENLIFDINDIFDARQKYQKEAYSQNR
jgi:hypothetical protein